MNEYLYLQQVQKEKIYKNYTTTGYKYSKNTILQITSVKENEKANGTELI